MSKAGAQASRQKKDAARVDTRQLREEAGAFLDVLVAVCDGCHMPVVVKGGQDCICGSQFGTFDSCPTVVLAKQ